MVKKIKAKDHSLIVQYCGKNLSSLYAPQKQAKKWCDDLFSRPLHSENLLVIGLGSGLEISELEKAVYQDACPIKNILCICFSVEICELVANDFEFCENIKIQAIKSLSDFESNKLVREFISGFFHLVEIPGDKIINIELYETILNVVVGRKIQYLNSLAHIRGECIDSKKIGALLRENELVSVKHLGNLDTSAMAARELIR